MVRQKTGMEHVRVCNNDIWRIILYFLLLIRSGIAIINCCRNTLSLKSRDKFVDCPELILFKSLDRKKIECPGLPVIQDGFQNRDVVRKCFAWGSWRCNNDIFLFPCPGYSLCLMTVEVGDPVPFECFLQLSGEGGYKIFAYRRPWLDCLMMNNLLVKILLTLQVIDKRVYQVNNLTSLLPFSWIPLWMTRFFPWEIPEL